MRRALVLALLFLLLPSPADALQAELIGDQIILSGGVSTGDYERFVRVLREGDGRVTTVILRNSPGGDAFVGMRIAQEIRNRGLRTAVSGYCRSACGRIFLGGVSRHFTSQYNAAATYLGFHATYETIGVSTNAYYQREWYRAMTDNRLDPVLVERWSQIRDRKGFMYFHDPKRLNRPDGVSVFLCQGQEKNRFDECEKIPGTDGYAQGIFTSAEIVRVNKHPEGKAP